MNYLTRITARLQELAAERGSELKPELAALYALLVLTTGQATTLENVHDAWSAWRAFSARPDHPMIVPLAMLNTATIEYDRAWRDDIRTVAAELEAAREAQGVLR
jgi:hypothetical protein